ncbi:hypothetical protein BDD12DRAFT_874960 [Trichophaea hybrida]|nr:hypothetical protein BDD12DRAFT_874960 [Trichophaea hybrida]
MPRKNRSKKGKEKTSQGECRKQDSRQGLASGTVCLAFSRAPQASGRDPLKPATVIERPVTPAERYATQGLRRLPFGERKYDSDCGSLPESQSDDDNSDNGYDDDNEHFHADEDDYKMDLIGIISEFVEEPLQTMREKFQSSLHKLEKRLQKQIDKTIDKNASDVTTLRAQLEKSGKRKSGAQDNCQRATD